MSHHPNQRAKMQDRTHSMTQDEAREQAVGWLNRNDPQFAWRDDALYVVDWRIRHMKYEGNSRAKAIKLHRRLRSWRYDKIEAEAEEIWREANAY